MRTLLAAAVGVLALAGSGSKASGVQTLYRSTTGPILAFAQDDDVLAWFSPGVRLNEAQQRRRCNAVQLLSLKGVKITLPKPRTDNVTCRWSVAGGSVRLALAAGAGDAALWTLHQEAQVHLDYVVGAAAGDSLERRFVQVAHSRAGAGLWLGGIAGSGSTLVYASTEIAYVDQVACLSGGSCAMRVAGGGVHRVAGRRDMLLRGTGPAVDVATAAGRIAVIPAATVGLGGVPQALAGRPVEVRDARTGTLVTQAIPDGVAEGVALSPHVVAVIESVGDGEAIVWFDAGSGRQLGEVRVPPETSTKIAADDQLVVFRVGRVIRGVDVATGAIRTLAKAAATPVGLSIAGTRLAWAENVRGLGRIRALELG